jgi:hypothetical protein
MGDIRGKGAQKFVRKEPTRKVVSLQVPSTEYEATPFCLQDRPGLPR